MPALLASTFIAFYGLSSSHDLSIILSFFLSALSPC